MAGRSATWSPGRRDARRTAWVQCFDERSTRSSSGETALTHSRLEVVTVFGATILLAVVFGTLPALSSVLTDPDEFGLGATLYGLLFVPQALVAIPVALWESTRSGRAGPKPLLLVGLAFDLVAMVFDPHQPVRHRRRGAHLRHPALLVDMHRRRIWAGHPCGYLPGRGLLPPAEGPRRPVPQWHGGLRTGDRAASGSRRRGYRIVVTDAGDPARGLCRHVACGIKVAAQSACLGDVG